MLDALAQEFDVRDEQVIADQLDLVAQFFGEHFPAPPIVLGAAVFDADDRIFRNELPIKIDQFLALELLARALLENVFAGIRIIEFGGRDVQGQENLFARFVTGVFDGLQDDLDCGFGTVEPGGKAALIAHSSGEAFFLEHRLEGVEAFGDGLQTLGKCIEPFGHNHEFLKINRGIRMSAAVNHIGHGHRQHLGVRPPKVFEKRQTKRLGGGFGVGKRDGQNGIGAELGFGLGAIQLEHDAVHGELVEGIHASEGGQDSLRHVFDRLGHTFAAVAFRVAIAQFQRFVFTGAGAGRPKSRPLPRWDCRGSQGSRGPGCHRSYSCQNSQCAGIIEATTCQSSRGHSPSPRSGSVDLFHFFCHRIAVIVCAMRRAREVVEKTVPRRRSKTRLSPSEQRLRRLLIQSQRSTDSGKKAQLKEKFIREFYEGTP